MADPFATALAALVGAPGSVAAVYNGVPGAIRVIRHQPSDTVSLGIGQAVLDGNLFVIRRADVALPKRGDTLAIGGEVLKVLADPMLDAEGLSWTVQAA